MSKPKNSTTKKHPHRAHKKRGFFGSLIAFCAKLCLYFMVISFLVVLLFRFVPVPFSAFMMETKIRAVINKEPADITYQWVPLSRIAPYYPNAVIAAEDQRFLTHHGFDFQAIEKAVKYNNSKRAKRKGKVKGASTISQQVAKNMFLWSDRSWVRKGFEVWFTALIELTWPKKRIIEVYLNIAQMGDNLFGVEAASRRYFNCTADEVSRAQAALVAASLPNPVRYRVDRPSMSMISKQGWILRQMGRLRREGTYRELMKK